MTQNMMILEHLKKHKGITSAEAMALFGCTRLSGRIFELKRMGHKIVGVMEHGHNRYGAPISWKRYSLKEDEA